MANKKTSEEWQAQAVDQASADVANAGVNFTPVSGDADAGDTRLNLSHVSNATLPAMPDPIFAQDDEGRDRPMSGGSFTRQSDGTLTRNLEA